MALVWKCDRCGVTEDSGNIDDAPEDWRHTTAPVRGSQGARSSRDVLICNNCDDALYEWWNRHE